MEKYKNLKNIVLNSLNGDLDKLTMQYENDHDLHIELEYKDQSEYRYRYEMIIEKFKKQIDFISHTLISGLDHPSLTRNQELEIGVFNYFFTN